MCAGLDGRTLYMAETLLWRNELREDQAIKMLDLETGAVTYLQSSPGTSLAIDSVTSMSFLGGGSKSELMVLCAPGGSVHLSICAVLQLSTVRHSCPFAQVDGRRYLAS